MKRVHFHSVSTLVLLGLVSSCSLPVFKSKPKLTSLKAGQTYEVRKALLANSYFDPVSARSSYFVYLPAPMPMDALAGTAAGTGQMTVRTTAYTHSEADHLIYGRNSAVGTPLKFGTVRSAAADWSRYPVGTRFRIQGQPDVIYEVDDYGSALVGTNTLDLYYPTRGMMNAWGARNVGIEVLEWGCFQRSAELMKDRVHFGHVRRMFNDILTHNRLMPAGVKKPEDTKPTQSPALPPPGLRAPHLAMML